MAVKSLLCGFVEKRFSAEYGLGCLSLAFFNEKITSHLAICEPHGWNRLLEDTVVINQPTLSRRPPELWGCWYRRDRKEEPCGEEMTGVPDGLSVASSEYSV